MELRHLKSFSAVAEQNSFTRAAESLGLTQAAVSQQVAALEKELDGRLFDRRGKSVTLTERGERLYAYSRQILDLLDAAATDLGRPEPAVSGVLRIAASTVPSEWLLPELLAEFRARYPHVTESLTVTDSSLAAEAVQSGAADVGFIGELPRSPALRATPVAEDDLCLVVGLDHPWATKGSATLHQLCREPLIVREPGSGSRHCVERKLEEHGISPAALSIVMEANSNYAIRDAVARSVGVAFLSRRAVTEGAGVAPVKVRGFQVRRSIYLIRDGDRHPPPACRAFVTFVETWRSQHREPTS